MIDINTIQAMRRYGGNFLKALAEAFVYADKDNQLRIVGAFPEYFAKYAVMGAWEKEKSEAKNKEIDKKLQADALAAMIEAKEEELAKSKLEAEALAPWADAKEKEKEKADLSL